MEKLPHHSETVTVHYEKDYTEEFFNEVLLDLVNIDSLNFAEYSWSEEIFREIMEQDRSVTTILHSNTGQIIGFCIAMSAKAAYANNDYEDRVCDSSIAYIAKIGIHPDFQGKKLVGLLLGAMDKALLEQGFEYVDRDTMIDNGYAEKIEKNYAGKIVLKEGPFPSSFGDQIYFRIKL